MGAWVLGMSAMVACSGAEQSGAQGSDLSSMVAALSVNSDGSDATWSDPADPEPARVRGCGYELIASKLAQRPDAEADGADEADDTETDSAEAASSSDDGAGPGAQRHRGDGRVAMLVRLYDANGDGELDDSELGTLKADIEARCEARFAKLVAEFDSNGDGELDAGEWAAAEAALHDRFERHHRDRMSQLDADGDGRLSADELSAGRDEAEQHRDGAEHAFDLDGDGELGAEEGERFREHGRQCLRDDVPMMSDAGETESAEPADVAGSDGEGDSSESAESAD